MIYFFAFIIIFIVSILFIKQIIENRNKKYYSFLFENSFAIKKVLELNEKYKFFSIKNFDQKKIYDNKHFYDEISCEDYLIYQLQFKQSEIKKQIEYSKINERNYRLYCNDISKICIWGHFENTSEKLNKNRLLFLEKQIFNNRIIKKPSSFLIKVVICRSDLNGNIFNRKSNIFNPEQILDLIDRLNDKYGSFFNDRGIWDAICRVERGKVSNRMRFAIYKRDGYRCQHCGTSGRFADLEIDHIKPIAKGGKSTYDNLQTLCKRCNQEKGDKF